MRSRRRRREHEGLGSGTYRSQRSPVHKPLAGMSLRSVADDAGQLLDSLGVRSAIAMGTSGE